MFAPLILNGCESRMRLGQSGSLMSGSAGEAISPQIVHCDRPLGTAALVEPTDQAQSLTSAGLQLPVPLLRPIMAQLGSFQLVDRGAALGNNSTEQQVDQSGMLQAGSTTARGRMVGVQYLCTTNVIFSNRNSDGLGGVAALGSLLGPAGAIASGGRRFDALLRGADRPVPDRRADRGGRGLEGAQFRRRQMRSTAPNLAPVTYGAVPQRSQRDLVRVHPARAESRGYYVGPVDGLHGKRANAAIAEYQHAYGQPTEDLSATPATNYRRHA